VSDEYREQETPMIEPPIRYAPGWMLGGEGQGS
jgi:hypothetical protein